VGCLSEEALTDDALDLLEHGFDKVSCRIRPESLGLEPQPIRSCLRKGDQAPHSAPELRRRVSWALPERTEVEVTPRASKSTPFQLAKFFDCHDGFMHSLKTEEASDVAKLSEVDVLRAALFEQSEEMDGASTDIDEEEDSCPATETEESTSDANPATEDSASDAEDVSEVQSEVPEVEDEELEDMGLDDEDETSLTSLSLDTWAPQKPMAPTAPSSLGTTWRRPSDRRRPQPVCTKSCWHERTSGQH